MLHITFTTSPSVYVCETVWIPALPVKEGQGLLFPPLRIPFHHLKRGKDDIPAILSLFHIFYHRYKSKYNRFFTAGYQMNNKNNNNK